MGLVLALALALDPDPGLPLERLLPGPVAVRARMLFLREGMSEAAVVRRMNLKDRFITSNGGTIWFHSTTYAIGRTHELTLCYEMTADGRSHGLTKATFDVRADK